MAEIKLSDVKQELKELNCKLKSLMDGTWAIIEPKGIKVIVPTLEAVQKYCDEKSGKNPPVKTVDITPEVFSTHQASIKPDEIQLAESVIVAERIASVAVEVEKNLSRASVDSAKPAEIFPSFQKIAIEEKSSDAVTILADALQDPDLAVENPPLSPALNPDAEHWRLQATGNWLDGQVFVLKGKTIIGRDSSCTITIPGGHLSRRHVEFLAYGTTLKMKDLGSSNGCYVNGKKVKEAIIKEGDAIKLDVITFKVLAPSAKPSIDEISQIAPEKSASIEPNMVDNKTVQMKKVEVKVEEKPVISPVSPTVSSVTSAASPTVNADATNKVPAVGSPQIADDQKRAIVAVNAFIYQIKEDRLQKGLNFIHSDIRKYVLFNGCPEPLLDKAMNYAESKLYKDCMDKVLIKRPFENHLGQKDVMYFDARYAAALGLTGK